MQGSRQKHCHCVRRCCCQLPEPGHTPVRAQACAPRPRTVLQDGFSLRAIDLLAPDEVAGGVSEIDETRLSVEVQCSGVHEVLDGDHVLIRHLGPHVHPADDAGTPLPVHQEQLVLGLCREKGAAPSPPARPGRAGASSQGGRNQKPLLALGPACQAAQGSRLPSSPPSFMALRRRAGLTFAGLPVTSQAEPGAAPAGASLVAVPQQADIRAAPRLSELVRLTGMAPHYMEREQWMGSGVHLPSLETIEGTQGQPCPCLVALGLGSPLAARSRAWHRAEMGRGLSQNLDQGGAESSTPCPSTLL